MTQFSREGNEIAWGTIGNASCAEGMFWESLNAGGVLGVPMLVSIWDDGYGISVPNEFQITKGNLSELLKGFQREPKQKAGYDIYAVKGWDYPALCETYIHASFIRAQRARPGRRSRHRDHATAGPLHVGQPGRYKSKERLKWENDFDCLVKMRQWMIAQGIATAEELDRYEKEDVKDGARSAAPRVGHIPSRDRH